MVAPQREFGPRKKSTEKVGLGEPEPYTPHRELGVGPVSFVDAYFLKNPESQVRAHIVEDTVKAWHEGEISGIEVEYALNDIKGEWLEFYRAVDESLPENPLPAFDELAELSEPEFAQTERALARAMGLKKAAEVVARLVFFEDLVKQTTEAVNELYKLEEARRKKLAS